MNDRFAFTLDAPRPVRIHLKTGNIVSEYDNSMAAYNGKMIEGGAATVLDLPLHSGKSLKELKRVKFRGKSTLKMEYAIKKHEKPPEPIQKVIRRKFSRQDDDNNEKVTKMEFMENYGDRTIVLQGLPINLTRKKIYKKVRKFGYVQDMKFLNGENSTDIGKICLYIKIYLYLIKTH